MQRQADSRFDEIYKRHHEDVTLYVRRRVAANSVEDLVAETFLVCWRKLDQVPGNALPWLYGVARKLLANHYRANATAPAHVDTSQLEAPGDPFLPIEQDDVLATAFSQLGEGDREILRLVAWEQLSLRAAGRVLECSPVACRVRFHRAKRRLAQLLESAESRGSAAPRQPHPKGATS
jgi:RNA polymerase sigma-70 factor, ECF subfamily